MTTGPLILASLLSAPSLLGFFARPAPVALPGGGTVRLPSAYAPVGFFDVYDKPARMLALPHQSGLLIAVWIFDSHGGVEKGRKTALDIAASFAP